MREIIIHTNKIKKIPLILAYILYPIINLSTRFAGYKLSNNWIDAVWGLLFLLSIPFILIKTRIVFKRNLFIIGIVGISISFIWVGLHLLVNLVNIRNQIELIPLLMELKPFFYLVFALLWIQIWGIPTDDNFIRSGVWLGIILMADFAIESALAGQIVRISGSGEINYDAMLLVLSICFLMANNKLGQRRYILQTTLIFLGLFASLSRTGLVTAILFVFIFWKINFPIKVSVVSATFFIVLLSFWVRGLEFTLVSADRFWMWDTAIKLFTDHPVEFLLGFGVQKLPVMIPPQLTVLWVDLQQAGWDLSGIYAYSFHAFWLRFVISWGVVATIPLFCLLGSFLFTQRSSILMRSLSLLFLIGGLTMGVVYLSNVGIPLIIAIVAGLMGSKLRIMESKKLNPGFENVSRPKSILSTK